MASQIQQREYTGWSLVLEIEGVSVPWKSVVSLVIREGVFDLLPRLELKITDAGFFSTTAVIRSGNTATVKLMGDNNEEPKSKFDFSINTVASNSSDPNLPQCSLLEINAVLKVPEMYNSLRTISFPKTRFSEVVRQISTNCGMESDIRVRSNDAMTWCCFNETYINFFKKNSDRTYVSSDECTVLFALRNGTMVFDGLKRASKCDTCVSLVYDKFGTVLPIKFDMGKVRQGKAKSKVNIPYSAWSRIDAKEYMDSFGGGLGSEVWWFDEGSKREEVTKEGKVDEKTVYGRMSQNVHKNYYKSFVNNRFIKNSMFSEVLTFTTGLYGFQPMDRVHIDIPETNEGGKVVSLSGEYLIFQVVEVFNKDMANDIVCAIKVS